MKITPIGTEQRGDVRQGHDVQIGAVAPSVNVLMKTSKYLDFITVTGGSS